MIVTLSGRSGLRNAYVSVLSAEGSSEISGASRWLDAWAAVGPPPRDASATNSAAEAAAARRTNASFRIVLSLLSAARDDLDRVSVGEDVVAPDTLTVEASGRPPDPRTATFLFELVVDRASDLPDGSRRREC